MEQTFSIVIFFCLISWCEGLDIAVNPGPPSSAGVLNIKFDAGLKSQPKQATQSQLLISIQHALDGLERRMGDRMRSMEDKFTFLEAKNDVKVKSTNRKVEELQTGLNAYENRIEDVIGQLRNHLNTNSNVFEHRLNSKLDSIENRIEDKIESNDNTCSKQKHLDAKLSALFSQLRTETKRDILDSLSNTSSLQQGEQRQGLEDICLRFEMTLNKTTDMLTSMEEDLDLLKSYGQENLVSVKNESDTIREMLMSREVVSSCGLKDNNDTDKDSNITSCYRGMNNSTTKNYPPYVVSTVDSLEQDILCDTKTDGGGWIVIQRRIKGDVDFYRNWADYKNGFGNLQGDFWLGNDAIHNLTSKHLYELRVDMKVNDQDLYASYTRFGIEDESDNYRLTLGSYSGTVGEKSDSGMSYHNGQAFTTLDRDNDRDSSNCAVKWRGAWWYKRCHLVNLNGLWGVRDSTGAEWCTGYNYYYPTSTEIKIRRV
ncbi:fibrinogen-related protein 3.2 [Elysia marginata]|uniref:Fibrinogen-related protein 3.2 n=1 Tax=Elysia marginata TaxID=1093978 RepID=A0AAV4JM01_9GAST|nr:fibrinogen-related protein 3.2 [Elysia marginata]